MKNEIRKNIVVQNLIELLKNSDMTIAQTLMSVLRPKYYSVKDIYFASDEEISNAIEQHLKELNISDEEVTEAELNEFLNRNTNRQ
jgi:hypothetical protein